MITRTVPSTWQELQTEVARVLSECGFKAETSKTVSTVRGTVELDVYAEETVKGRRYSIACECKYWAARIPQSIVHGFRTVVADIGANIGYIVSKAGFQCGSFEASELTNLRLVTWEEFLLEFEGTWYDSYFAQEVHRRLSPIMTYAEPFKPAWYDRLSRPDQERYRDLKAEYDLFGMIVQSFGPYTRMLGPEKAPPTLPLESRLEPHEILRTIPEPILKETAYREFLDLCTEHGEEGIRKFRALRDKVGGDDGDD
jgi:hypothetical protein